MNKKYLKNSMGFVIAMGIILIASSIGLLVYSVSNSKWIFIATFCVATSILLFLTPKIPYIKGYIIDWGKLKWIN